MGLIRSVLNSGQVSWFGYLRNEDDVRIAQALMKDNNTNPEVRIGEVRKSTRWSLDGERAMETHAFFVYLDNDCNMTVAIEQGSYVNIWERAPEESEEGLEPVRLSQVANNEETT